MTVTATSTRDDYTVTLQGETSFAYNFKVLAETDVTVYKNNIVVSSSGYTVTNVGTVTGGNVVLNTGANLNDTISIVLTMPVTRDTNYQENGAFLAEDVNGDFDKIYIGAIQNENAIDRTIRLSDAENIPVDMTLPLKDQRKGKFLKFHDTTGSVQVVDPSAIGTEYTAGSGLALSPSNEFSNTAPDQTVSLTGAGTTNVTGTYPNFTITGSGTTYTAGSGLSLTGTEFANTAPDQTVSLTGSAGISTSGIYPDFFIINDAPDQTVSLTGGTGISTSGTYPNFTVTNDAPDQTVALTGAGSTTISGTYPNFTITSTGGGGGIELTDLSATVGSPGTTSLAYNNTNGVFTYTPPDLSSYLTADSTATLTNKSGNISQWTNDSGYTTNAGDVTLAGNNSFTGLNSFSNTTTFNGEVAANAGISSNNNLLFATGGSEQMRISSAGNVGIGTTVPSAALDVNGTIEFNGLSGIGTVTVTNILDEDTMASNSATALATQQSIKAYVDANAGGGDITAVTAGTGLTGGGTTGAVTLNAVGGTGITAGANDISLDLATSTTRGGIELFSDTDQSVAANAVTTTANRTYGIQLNSSNQAVVNVPWVTGAGGGIALTDLSAVTASPGTTGLAYDNTSGVFTYTPAVAITNNNQLINGAGYTTNTGTVTPSSTDTFTNKSGNISQWTNDSGYTTNVGDITAVTAGSGMTGGGTSGAVTIDVVGGDGITASPDFIAVDSTVIRTTGVQTKSGQMNFNDVVRINNTNATLRLEAGLNNPASIQFGDSADVDVGKIVYNNFNNSMAFNTNTAERARIDTSGNFLLNKTALNSTNVGVELTPVGTISNTCNLNSLSGISVRNNSGTASLAGFKCYSGRTDITSTSSTGGGHSISVTGGLSGEYARFTNAKRLGIGISAPTQALHVVGDIVATGNITANFSDERLKDFQGTIPNALDKVAQLNGYYYTPNETAQSLGVDNNGLEVGISAQEVEAVLPEIVADSVIGEGYKTVMYERLTPLLIEAVKELAEKVEKLELKLTEMEK